MILDSRIKYVDYEAFLLPMVDFANFRENPENPSRVFKANFDSAYTKTVINAPYDLKRDEQLFVNIGFNNDNYLLYHGFVLKDNSHDCYSTSLSFSERQDDPLREHRKVFFARYFLYDKNVQDQM